MAQRRAEVTAYVASKMNTELCSLKKKRKKSTRDKKCYTKTHLCEKQRNRTLARLQNILHVHSFLSHDALK